MNRKVLLMFLLPISLLLLVSLSCNSSYHKARYDICPTFSMTGKSAEKQSEVNTQLNFNSNVLAVNSEN